jgi:hypothetical protein
MSFNALIQSLRSFSWREWALVAMVTIISVALFHTIGMTLGPLVGYLMVLGLRRTRANRQKVRARSGQ